MSDPAAWLPGSWKILHTRRLTCLQSTTAARLLLVPNGLKNKVAYGALVFYRAAFLRCRNVDGYPRAALVSLCRSAVLLLYEIRPGASSEELKLTISAARRLTYGIAIGDDRLAAQ